MSLPTIPRNAYPLRPSGYAAYWQRKQTSQGQILAPRGCVPLWVTYHDGAGPGRILNVMVVRVRPDMEVVLIGRFGDDIRSLEIERVIRGRLSPSSWPERVWYISHIVYVAQPGKRKKSGSRFRYERFCTGAVTIRREKSYMLAFIPVSRLKVDVRPRSQEDVLDEQCHVHFEVDASKQRYASVRSFVTRLAQMERWEQNIVHLALGHLFGTSYVDALTRASSQLGKVGIPELSKMRSERLRSLLSRPSEGFRPPRWLKDPDSDEDRIIVQALIGITRFPMGGGPDPEISLRPWLSPALLDVMSPTVPISPCSDIAIEILPDRSSGSFAIRAVVGALNAYRSHD